MDEFATESAYPMISFDEAWRLIASHIAPLPPSWVGLRQLLGYVLAEEIVSDVNVPSAPTSRMDGYAVLAADTAHERRVLGQQEAGVVLDVTVRPGTALRIMTGAPLPPGADAVIPVEDTAEHDGVVTIRRSLRPGDYVRPVGVDLAIGDVVMEAGTVLGPAEIGLVATLGRTGASVYPKPRVLVLATGDELVQPGEPLPPGKIYDSNSYAVSAAVEAAGFVPVQSERRVVLDSEEALRSALLEAVRGANGSRVDAIVTSGGVSMGTRDLLKPVLASLGTIYFGRVAMQPGKPLTFALVEGVPVFSLPGFPVSSLVLFELIARPALRLMAGHRRLWRPEARVRVSHRLRHDPERTEFQRAVLTERDGETWATTTGSQLSSRLKSLLGANALLRIPQGVGDVEAGEMVEAILIHQPETR